MMSKQNFECSFPQEIMANCVVCSFISARFSQKFAVPRKSQWPHAFMKRGHTCLRPTSADTCHTRSASVTKQPKHWVYFEKQT